MREKARYRLQGYLRTRKKIYCSKKPRRREQASERGVCGPSNTKVFEEHVGIDFRGGGVETKGRTEEQRNLTEKSVG